MTSDLEETGDFQRPTAAPYLAHRSAGSLGRIMAPTFPGAAVWIDLKLMRIDSIIYQSCVCLLIDFFIIFVKNNLKIDS